MRDILFRGKRLDIGKWVYGGYFKHDKVKVCFTSDDPKTKHCIISDGSCDWGFEPPLEYCEVDSETVGQFLEMHDRHNTPVFENDIVEFIGGSTSRYLIWWNREMSMMTAVPLHGIYFNGNDYGNGDYPNFNYSIFCLMMQNPWGDFSDIRVIGNIHDNPELLDECKHYNTEVLPDGRF